KRSKKRVVQEGMQNLTALSDRQLFESLKHLVARECELVADVVAHLVEVDKRKLYLAYPCPGLTAYCQEALGYSEDAAANRVIAPRIARRYPVVLVMLRDKHLHLAAVRTIAQYLSDDNYEARLQEARGKTRQQLQELVAAWSPRPDVPSRVLSVKQAPA